MNNQNIVFSSLIKEDYLEKLVLRNEELRKLFANLNRFFSENCKIFEIFGKSLQKISFSLEDYIKKYVSDERNCFFMARLFSSSLSSFGSDQTKLFNSLANDINSSLVVIHENISTNKRNYLDLLIFNVSNYNNLETEYLKLLTKYKAFSKDAEDALFNYHESLKEAKTIYNLSIMNRNLSKVQKIVNKTLKYETRLKSSISNLNNKRKEVIVIIVEALSHFKSCYKLSLSKFFEISKKNFDALGSFMSLFSQTIKQKKEMIRTLDEPINYLPNPQEFKFSNTLETENYEKEKEKIQNSLTNIENHSNGKWPDFLENPQQISDLNVYDFYDWVQNYVEKFFKTSMERRKILKHLKIGIKDLADEHEFLSKGLAKTMKNIPIVASWNTFGEKLFAIGQVFNQIFDYITKKIIGFSNFTQIKIGVFESILTDIERNTKIAYSSALKTLKDHFQLRNSVYKNQSSKLKKTVSDVPISQARNSLNETANNLKMIINEYNNEEKKRVDFFKENLMMVLSQMEFFFAEIHNFLQSQNEKVFQEVNKSFIEDTESLFYKLIHSDSKLNELFKSTYKETILLEKNKDVEFYRNFDPDSNPLYLKIINKSINNTEPDENGPQTQRSSIKKDEIKRDSMSKIEINQRSTIKDQKVTFEEIEKSVNNFNKLEEPLSASISKRKSQENVDLLPENNDTEKKLSFSNFDSPMLNKRRKSLDSCDNLSPGLEDSPGLKSIKPFKCDEIVEARRSKVDVLSDSEKPNVNSNMDLKFTPKKKKSTYSFFRNKFGITQGEIIDSVYSCALSDKMLVQGKMFISNKKIGFHSYFNKHTFIGETKMIIPKNDIIKIEKRYNAVIFDNSIAIVTPRGELFFTSFVFRDKAYISIVKMIQPPEQKDLNAILNENNSNAATQKINDDNNNLEEKKDVSPLVQMAIPTSTESVDPNILKKLEERAQIVKDIAPKDHFFHESIYRLKVPSFIQRVEDVYRILFSDDIISFKGKNYKGYWEYFKVVKSEDINYSMSALDPPPPKFFQTSENVEELVNAPHFSERKIEFTHPVRKTGIPFMPKTCPVKENHKLYWISNKEFRLVCDVKTEKIPYTDCFYICLCYIITQHESKNIEIVVRFKIVWIKSTILKDTIEKRVTGETIDTTNNIVLPTFLDFLKHVYPSAEYQSKYPVNKGGVDNNNANSNKEMNVAPIAPNANEEQNEEILNKLASCKNEIEDLKGKIQRNEIILFVFVGLYICSILNSLLSYFLT